MPGHKKSNSFALLLLLLAVLWPFPTGCIQKKDAGDEIYRLKLGHDQTAGHPYDLGVRRFADAVTSATGGKVEILIYPSAQLGDTPEQIEGLRLGALDLCLAAFSHASQFVPELGIFSAPFLVDDADHFAAVFNGRVGSELDRTAETRYRIRLLAAFYSGHRILFNRKHPVTKLEDIAGLKIRVMAGEADAATWKAFGAIPSPIPYSEVYSALQAGVIDGAENEPVSILANKFYETCRYFSMTEHLILPMGLFMSAGTLQKLPETYRTLMFEEARKAADWERGYIQRENQKAMAAMVERYSVRVDYPPKDEFIKRAEPIQERLARKWNVEGLLDMIRRAGNRGR